MDKVRMDRKAGIHMIGIFIALLSGALMSVQGVFNTQVTKAPVSGWQMCLYSSRRCLSVLPHI